MSEETAAAQRRLKKWIDGLLEARDNKTEAELVADSESLERAADLELIYNSFEWVQDMPPAPKRRLGRRVNPKSREQFAKWVKARYGWGTRQHLARLQEARELLPVIAPMGAGIAPSGERVLRPFAKLRAQGYADVQGYVWQRAIEIAEGEAPTESQVRKAVNEYLDARKPAIKNTAKDPRTKEQIRKANREKWLREFHALMEEDNREAKELLNAAIKDFKQHQEVLTEERALTA